MVHYFLDGEDLVADPVVDEDKRHYAELIDELLTEPDDWDDDDFDGQPDTYTEYQDLHGGDDWDHGQYDEF